jgi:hypothetical protein
VGNSTTVWSTVASSWLGGNTLRLWCSYQGVTCQTDPIAPNFARVYGIELISRGLSGSLPSEIGAFKFTKDFDLVYNQISGSIPSTIASMTSLRYVNLYDNRLAGTIPTGIFGLPTLSYLSLE